jgi:hypothetical protein
MAGIAGGGPIWTLGMLRPKSHQLVHCWKLETAIVYIFQTPFNLAVPMQ